MSNTLKGIILAVVAAIFWGTYGTFVTFLMNFGFSETAVAVFAPVGIIIFFFILTLINCKHLLKPTKKQFLIYLLCGVIGVTGTNVLYAAGLGTGFSMGMASVITFANYFLVMIASRFIWKIKITSAKIGAGIIAIVGIAMLLQVWTDMTFSGMGLFFIVATACTFAFSYVMTKFAFENAGSEPDAFYFWINLIGFIVTCFINPPWSVFTEIGTVYAASGAIAIVALLGFMLIPQCGQYFLLGRSFLYLEAPIVVIIFALDPVVSSLLGYFIFGQSLNLIQILGMGIIIAGLAWLQITELKADRLAASQSNATSPKSGNE